MRFSFNYHFYTLQNDVYENLNHYNPRWKGKILIAFDDMIADILSNQKFQAIIKELFLVAEN